MSPPPVATLAVVIALAVPLPALGQAPSFDPAAVYKAPRGNGPRRGPADAPITIVAWSDFHCGYCNRVERTLEQLDRLFPGKLQWVFRHLPLDEDETLAAQASAAAAAQGRFWPMKQRLFSIKDKTDRVAIEQIAADLGLDLMRFRNQLDAGSHLAHISSDTAAASALGVVGTPMFFINGRPLSGNQPLSAFAEVIDSELTKVRQLGLGDGADVYAVRTENGRAQADASEPGAKRVRLADNDRVAVGLGLPGHQDGSDAALVTIVEFADFECPYCIRNAPTLQRLRSELAGDVRVVFRHLPLPFHHRATLAAEAAVAAGAQGKFWAFHARVLAEPAALSVEDLRRHANAIGLDVARFDRELAARTHREAVALDTSAGGALGVDGTPTIFINGRAVIGAKPYAAVRAIVDEELAIARQLVARGVARGDVYALRMLEGTRRDKADPLQIPTTGGLELDPADREGAVVAACRRRDQPSAQRLVAKLRGRAASSVTRLCEAVGVDLK